MEEQGYRDVKPVDFRGVGLAPMVRVSYLPIRMACTKMGADYVMTEETIDRSLELCKRVYDEETGTIYYKIKHNPIVRTSIHEKNCVLQIGTCNAPRAVLISQKTHRDFAGINLNCGCPVPKNTKNGIGAALLKSPETIHDILTSLVREIPSTCPISCKIRILPTLEETLDLCRMIATTGVSTLIVHGRTADLPYYSKPVEWDMLQAIVDNIRDVNVVVNGNILSRRHADETIQKTGAWGCLIGRAALESIRVFSPDFDDADRESEFQLERRYEASKSILDYAIQTGQESPHKLKNVLQKNFTASSSKRFRQANHQLGLSIIRSQTMDELVEIFKKHHKNMMGSQMEGDAGSSSP